jgi:hypothetical protein
MPRKSTIETLPRDVLERLNFLVGEGALSIDALTLWLDEQGHARSRTAVGRHAKKINAVREKLSQSREISKALVAEIGDDLTSSKQGRMIVEILRTLVFEHLTKQMEDGAEVDPQSFFFLAKAIKDVAGANRLDQDYETRVRDRIVKEEREKAAETATSVATKAGLSAEAAEQIRNKILGTS